MRYEVHAMLLVAITLLMFLFPSTSAMAASELQEAKDVAVMVEEYLGKLQPLVEEAYAEGRISRKAWERYDTIRWHAGALLRVMTMAVLFYEEAPNESHCRLISVSAESLSDILTMLDNYCSAIGIETPAFGPYKETARIPKLQPRSHAACT